MASQYSTTLKFVIWLLVLTVVVTVPLTAYAQTPPPDFTVGCDEVKFTTGERPLLVILLGPDDPFWHPHINMFARKQDGFIYQKTFLMLEPTSSQIHFKAQNGQYLVAENGGGGAVTANSNGTAAQETFYLDDLNGGSLMSGDSIQLKTSDEKHYLVAENGGGQEINATRTEARTWETFVITKHGGGPIRHGDKIFLSTHNGNYLAAVGGGGGAVNATSTAIGNWETFTLITSRHWNKDIPLPQTHKFQSAPTVVMSADGTLQSVFALGDDGYIYQTFTSVFDTDDTWQPWARLPGQTKFKSTPIAFNTPDGFLLGVLATGEDGFVYQILYSRGPDSQWQQQWTRLPGQTKFKSAPTAFNTPDGSLLSVLATGEDGFVYQILYTRGSGSQWQQQWTRLPGQTKFKSAPTAFNTPDGSLLSVLATGEDGFVYQILYTRGSGSQWQRQWTRLPGNQRFHSAPWSMNSADGKFVMVYALGEDDRIYENVFIRGPGADWTNWQELPGVNSFDSAPAAIHGLARKYPPEYYREMLFGTAKSVRGFFLENSYNQFTFKEAYITSWLTAQDDPSTPLDESSFDYLHQFDGKPNSLERKSNWIVQHVEQLTPFRFSTYDRNQDGKVTHDELAILWVYPGGGDARGREFSPPVVPVPSLATGVEMGLLVRGGSGMSMATIAHELGHQTLGLGDLYPQVGEFSLMGYQGSGNHLDPWSKIKLGWLQPKVVTTSGFYSLNPIETHPDALILYNSQKDAQEYFIVENRWPRGSYENHLPDSGLAIWRINEQECPEKFDSRKTINLVSPLGSDELRLWDGTSPLTGYDFAPTSTPVNSSWSDGTFSGISVINVPASAPYAQFYVDVP